MTDFRKTIYRDAGKPDAAVPVTNGCALPGSAMTGELTVSPIPIPQKRGTNAVNGTNGNGRLAQLQERQKQLEAQLAAEKLRLAKKRQQDDKKLFALVGRAVCQAADRSSEFHAAVEQNLAGLSGNLTEAEQNFLKARGWELS